MDWNFRELAAALDLLPQAVLLVEARGRIVARNAAAQAMLGDGWDVGEVLATRPAGAIDWQAELSAIADGSAGRRHQDVCLDGRDGRQQTVDLWLRPLPTGGQAAALVVIADVSDRLTMERRLAAAERLAGVGEVAARVAHELNTPLDGVMRYVGLAERHAGDQATKYLQAAREGLVRMADIIRDLQRQGGLRAAGPQNCPVERLLDEAVRVMQPRTQALGVTVACDLAEDASVAVEAGMFQVFCNIIKNALDAMPGGGLLNVRLRRSGQEVTVEFCDSGCGIAADQAEKIFEPFYTTKAPGQGCGLGLTICREILARSGGTVTAAPREDGGARITVRLPLPQQAAKP